MSGSGKRRRVEGSERTPLPDAERKGPADPDQPMYVTVVVRPREQIGDRAEDLSARPPTARSYLNREELAAAHGARPEDLAAVEAFAGDSGLEVVKSDIGRRSVILRGPVAAFRAAFMVDLDRWEYAGGSYRG